MLRNCGAGMALLREARLGETRRRGREHVQAPRHRSGTASTSDFTAVTGTVSRCYSRESARASGYNRVWLGVVQGSGSAVARYSIGSVGQHSTAQYKAACIAHEHR